MTVKSFSFLNPISDDAHERNWRQFDENSKFKVWTPEVGNMVNVTEKIGYYQLYGPMCFYWIRLYGAGLGWSGTGGTVPYIYNLPYRGEAVSNIPGVNDRQFLDAVDASGVDLTIGNKAVLQVPATTPIITLPLPAVGTTWRGSNFAFVYGWFFRNT